MGQKYQNLRHLQTAISQARNMLLTNFQRLQLQGVPKKIGLLSCFEFLGLGGVIIGVKNNSKNSGTEKI